MRIGHSILAFKSLCLCRGKLDEGLCHMLPRMTVLIAFQQLSINLSLPAATLASHHARALDNDISPEPFSADLEPDLGLALLNMLSERTTRV